MDGFVQNQMKDFKTEEFVLGWRWIWNVNFQTTHFLVKFETWIHIHVISAYMYAYCKCGKNQYN